MEISQNDVNYALEHLWPLSDILLTHVSEKFGLPSAVFRRYINIIYFTIVCILVPMFELYNNFLTYNIFQLDLLKTFRQQFNLEKRPQKFDYQLIPKKSKNQSTRKSMKMAWLSAHMLFIKLTFQIIHVNEISRPNVSNCLLKWPFLQVKNSINLTKNYSFLENCAF